MNKDRRKELAKLKERVESVAAEVAELIAELETVRDEEQDYYDNMPESIQYGEKGERAEAAVGAIADAIDQLEQFDADSIVAQIEEAAE